MAAPTKLKQRLLSSTAVIPALHPSPPYIVDLAKEAFESFMKKWEEAFGRPN